MSKSNKYGYSGVDIPTQAFKANVGKFDPDEINELVQEGKWTTFGQLELIQTQTFSSSTAVFSSLEEETYNIHLITFTDVHFSGQSEFDYQLSSDGGSSYLTGYQFANQRGNKSGSFDERKSTGQDGARLCGDLDDGAHSLANGYMYLYNTGDNTKYTFSTSHMTFTDNADKLNFEFGGAVRATKEKHNAIKFGQGVGATALTSATISLYGLRNS